jgi:hypothetical protein
MLVGGQGLMRTTQMLLVFQSLVVRLLVKDGSDTELRRNRDERTLTRLRR